MSGDKRQGAALLTVTRDRALAPWTLDHWVLLATFTAVGGLVSVVACVYVGYLIGAPHCGETISMDRKHAVRLGLATIAVLPFVMAAPFRPRRRLLAAALASASPALFSVVTSYTDAGFLDPFCF